MATLDWVLIIAYLAVLIVITAFSIKRVRTPDDFAVAGGKLPASVLFATMAASVLGGGAGFGTAGETFSNGYVYMLAAFAIPLQVLLVGLFVAPKMTAYRGAQTVGDVMEHHYGRLARFLTGVFSIGLCSGTLASQVLALGLIFNTVLGVSINIGIVIGMSVVLLYSTVGGMWAVVQTDVLQFVILGIFIPVTVLVAVMRVGGPGDLLAAVPESHLTIGGNWGLALFLSTFLAIILGETLAPPYAQRAFATTDARAARRSFIAAGTFGFGFFFITATIGLAALALFPDIEPDQAMATVVQQLLPAGLSGLVIAALMAVVMSTSDSFLNSTAVVFVRDIYKPFINPRITAARTLTAQRVVTLVVGIAASLLAMSATSIIDLILQIYVVWAPTVVVPLILAVVWRYQSTKAALSAIITGALATAVWTWVLDEPFGVGGLVVGVGCNVLTFFLVYLAFDRGNRAPVPQRDEVTS